MASSVVLLFVILSGRWIFGLGGNLSDSLDHNRSPCRRAPDITSYQRFLEKHVLQENFTTRSTESWRRYLRRRNLCGRVQKQTFMLQQDEEKVKGICNGGGVQQRQNLCKSLEEFEIFDIESKGNCHIQSLIPKRSYIVVACDLFPSSGTKHECLPSHYGYENNREPRIINEEKICRARHEI